MCVCVCKLQTPNMEKIHEVMHNPTKMSQMMTVTSNLPSFVADKMSRTYASWLQWWKSTVTADDYMKYLSTLVSLSCIVPVHTGELVMHSTSPHW